MSHGRRLLVGALTGLLTAGCEDASMDPMATLSTVETVPSLTLSVPLPSMKDLGDRIYGEVRLERAVSKWEASWAQPDGDLMRIEARAVAVPILHQALGESTVRSTLRSMSWVEEDPELLVQVPTSISEQVLSATILLGRGREALEAGDSEDALAWVLSASDEIRAVTDEGVAHRLVGTGEALLDEADESILEVARARRMMNGARRALTEGEYRLAIERAFYARQLLEGAEHSPLAARR